MPLTVVLGPILKRMKIRDGQVGDDKDAVALWVDAHAARTGERSRSLRGEGFRLSLHSPDSLVVVAEEDGRLVGLVLGRQGRSDDGAGPPVAGLIHISAVFVSPEHWGKGIGRELVSAILRRARIRNYDKAQLWTQSDNERATRLYERLGFKKSGREKIHAGESIIHYELDLRQEL